MKILESETSTWEKQKNICLVNETKHYLFKTNKNIIRILKLNRHDPTGQNHGKTISLFKNKSKEIGEEEINRRRKGVAPETGPRKTVSCSDLFQNKRRKVIGILRAKYPSCEES